MKYVERLKKCMQINGRRLLATMRPIADIGIGSRNNSNATHACARNPPNLTETC
jgi:hypothetical protein